MTKLVLIRHGQTEWNIAGKYQGQSDVALSDKGIEQARCLAQNFPLEQLDAVYASDLSRALVTAEQVARHFGCVVQPEPSLREMNFGEWEGLTYKQIAAQWPEAMGTFFQRPDMLEIPGGEGFAVLQERAVKCIEEIVASNVGKTVAVVAHGAILRTILTHVLHMPLRYVWTIRQDNTAVNILRYDEGNCMVELVNSTAHLQK